MAYVGSFAPDLPKYTTREFSRAGNLFQTSLLQGMIDAGVDVTLVLAQMPIPSYPRGAILWRRGETVGDFGGTPIRLIPFINVTVLRQITVGIVTLAALVRWSWRNRKRPRIIYQCNLTEPMGLVTYLAAKLTGAKFVAALLDINVPGHTVPDTFIHRLNYALHRWLIPRLDGATVVSDAIIHDFAPDLPHIRLAGGVSDDVIRFFATSPRRTPDGLVTIAVAGFLHDFNGIQEILEAFRMLEGDHYRLKIAGTGPLADLVQEAARADHRIEYLGFLEFQDVLRLYLDADLLINMRITTKIDVKYFFPSKTFECLASGTPVIATAPGHMREEFGSFSYLLDEETPEALARMIEKVAALPVEERLETGARAHAYAREFLTWKSGGRRILELMNRIADR